jgi:hypothetical protein
MNLTFIIVHDNIIKSGYFKGMLDRNISNDNDEILCEINQRSSSTFKYLLAYLNDPHYPFPKNLAYELDYYDIQYDINKLHDINDKLYNLLNKVISESTIVKCNYKDYKKCDNYFIFNKNSNFHYCHKHR